MGGRRAEGGGRRAEGGERRAEGRVEGVSRTVAVPGLKGFKGFTSFEGSKGPKGSKGAKGPRGVAGFEGFEGFTGVKTHLGFFQGFLEFGQELGDPAAARHGAAPHCLDDDLDSNVRAWEFRV